MRWVLLKINDEATEAFVQKASRRVIGVWDIPEDFCHCPENQGGRLANWMRDPDMQRPVCKTCRKPHSVYLSGLGARTRWAFGRNLIGQFLPGRKDLP